MGGQTILPALCEEFQSSIAGPRTRLVSCGGAGSVVERTRLYAESYSKGDYVNAGLSCCRKLPEGISGFKEWCFQSTKSVVR